MQERRVPEALLGTYVATALVPAAALATAAPLASVRDAGVLVGGGLLVAAVVAVLARSVDELTAVVTAPPVVAVCVLPPLAYLPYMVVATEPASTAALLSVVGLVAVVPGLFVPIAGAVVTSRRERRQATEAVVVTVGEDEDDEQEWAVVLGVLFVGAGFAVAGAFTLASGDVDVMPFVTMLGGLSTILTFLGADGSQEVAVTDRGVRVDRSFTRWDRLAGYRVTDDALELVRPEWYHPTPSFAREDVEDEAFERLREALAEHLPRLDSEGRVEMPARR